MCVGGGVEVGVYECGGGVEVGVCECGRGVEVGVCVWGEEWRWECVSVGGRSRGGSV